MGQAAGLIWRREFFFSFPFRSEFMDFLILKGVANATGDEPRNASLPKPLRCGPDLLHLAKFGLKNLLSSLLARQGNKSSKFVVDRICMKTSFELRFSTPSHLIVFHR